MVTVHISAYTAHTVAIAGKLLFTGKSRSKMSFHYVISLWGGELVLTAGFEHRVPGLSDLVVVTGERQPLNAKKVVMAGKLWFVSNGHLKSGQNIGKSC